MVADWARTLAVSGEGNRFLRTVAEISDLSTNVMRQEDILSRLLQGQMEVVTGAVPHQWASNTGLSPSQGAGQQGLGQWGRWPGRACFICNGHLLCARLWKGQEGESYRPLFGSS